MNPYRSPFLPPLPAVPEEPVRDDRPIGSGPRLSILLADLAADPSRERISITDLMATMQVRAIGALILIFALPNAVPTPPGTSAILGLPLVYLTLQLMLGTTPWLPRFISDRSISRKDFAAVVAKISPWLARAERLLRARMPQMTMPATERLVGALCFLLAIVLFLPIPLGNMLPAIAISIIALGILERDGVWILSGCIIGVLALLIVWGVVVAFLKMAAFMISHAFAG